MFKVGDIVQHEQTGRIGKVVGYGCRLTDATYFLTLKVKPINRISLRSIEDNFNQWRFVRHHLPIVIQSRQDRVAA